MRNDLIIEFWTKDNLLCWSPFLLENTKIPTLSKDYLIKTGLPINVDWTQNFKINNSKIQRIENDSKFIIIGYDDVMPICIDENTGKVYIIESNISEKRFINSNVEFLGYFLMLYQKYRIQAKDMDEDEIMDLIDMTEKEMKLKDNNAMDYEENYWPIIIEQMRDGLL